MCGKCHGAITAAKGQGDSLKCSGFCGKFFHATSECTNLAKSDQSFDRNALLALRNHDSIIFMCAGCRTCLKNTAFIELATKVESVFAKLDDFKVELMENFKDALTSFKDNFQDKFQENIKELSTKISQPPSNVSQSYASVTQSHMPNTSVTPEIIGTGGNDDLIQSVPVQKRKFVFVSRIKNTTTAQTVTNYLKKKLEIGDDKDILCWPLVKREIDASSMNFISFKIGVFENHFEKMLSNSFWPDGVLVREFIPKNVNQSKNQAVELE